MNRMIMQSVVAVVLCVTLTPGVAPLQENHGGKEPTVPGAVDRSARLRLSEQVSVDVSCWVSSHVVSLITEPADLVRIHRFVCVSAVFNVNQIILNHSRLNGPIEVTSHVPLRVEARNLSPSLAKIYAAKTLGEAIPPAGDDLSGPFLVEIRPRSGLSWGEVATVTDIEIVHVDA